MRTFTLLFSALVLSTTAVQAQTVATFESLSLATTDTYYVNYSAPGTDVGFSDGLAYFPCVYDTGFGTSFLSYGWVYSNMTDTVSSSFTNQFSAKAGKGFGGSAKYNVAYCYNPATFANTLNLKLTGAAIGKKVNGFFVTNSTYAYNSMRDGDGFAKKFGGVTGNDPDWFKLTVRGYAAGTLKADSVSFYLADYRTGGTALDYIVKNWTWVNLLPLGNVDSLQFKLTSSDNGSFGMNTPSYFCMDDFNTNETNITAVPVANAFVAKVYPNPAADVLYVDVANGVADELVVTDVAGGVAAVVKVTAAHMEISTSALPAGMYILQVKGEGRVGAIKFVKQ
ncbi:MAG: DUF4465 domain-containing protein [Bacteroidota bacterium]